QPESAVAQAQPAMFVQGPVRTARDVAEVAPGERVGHAVFVVPRGIQVVESGVPSVAPVMVAAGEIVFGPKPWSEVGVKGPKTKFPVPRPGLDRFFGFVAPLQYHFNVVVQLCREAAGGSGPIRENVSVSRQPQFVSRAVALPE